LSSAFNAMDRDVATVMVQRERIDDELREARDKLERRVEERTLELTDEITERKLAEESMTRLGAAIENLSELFVLYDPDNKLVICNKNYRDLNSETPDTIVPGAKFEDHQRALIEKDLYDGIEGHEEEWLKERIKLHKNPTGLFEIFRNGRCLLVNEQRLPDGSIAIVSTDITEHKQTEGALLQSEERLRGAIESLREGFALFDADNRLVALNDVYLEVSPGAQDVLDNGGYFEDVIRSNVNTGKIVEAQGREDEFITERVRQHQNPEGPIIRRFTDGNWSMVNEVHTPEGGIALSFIDVTEIKNAEEALRDSQQRFKDIAEVASDWFWEMDQNLRF
jgi:PAS domain-containing protein